MKVQIEEGRLVAMSKTMPTEMASGENVGMLYLSEDSVRRLFEIADELVSDGEENAWLSSAVCELSKRSPISCLDVAGLPWGEIDFPYDLQAVRREVWPRIKRDRRNRFRLRAFAVAEMAV